VYRRRVKKRLAQLGAAIAAWSAAVTIAAGGAAAAPFDGARTVADPAAASRAEYGRIDRPGEVRSYSVTAGQTVAVTIEAVVPARVASAGFRPTVAVMLPGAERDRSTVPFPVPTDYGVRTIAPDRGEPRRLFDPTSIERFYRNGSAAVTLPGGR